MRKGSGKVKAKMGGKFKKENGKKMEEKQKKEVKMSSSNEGSRNGGRGRREESKVGRC